jgi:hypothetical protein
MTNDAFALNKIVWAMLDFNTFSSNRIARRAGCDLTIVNKIFAILRERRIIENIAAKSGLFKVARGRRADIRTMAIMSDRDVYEAKQNALEKECEARCGPLPLMAARGLLLEAEEKRHSPDTESLCGTIYYGWTKLAALRRDLEHAGRAAVEKWAAEGARIAKKFMAMEGEILRKLDKPGEFSVGRDRWTNVMGGLDKLGHATRGRVHKALFNGRPNVPHEIRRGLDEASRVHRRH